MTQVINNSYHLEVIVNMLKHRNFNTVPILYIVERVRQMFPEYRSESLKSALTEQISELCFTHQDWS